MLASCGQVAKEFQQADHFGHPQRPALVFRVTFEALADLVDVGTFFIREVAFNQFEDFVECDQHAQRLVGHGGTIRHQHLVRLFDDRPVAPP